jgi:hypothetical protein
MLASVAALTTAYDDADAEALQPPVTLGAGDRAVSTTLPIGTYVGVGPATRLVCSPGLDNLFAGTGTLVLKDLTLVGNGTGKSYASGFAAYVWDGSIELDGVTLENFRSSYWVLGKNSRLTARGVTARSRHGNAINGSAINEVAYVLAVRDGELYVDNCTLHCDYIKGGVSVWGASRATITRTTITESGTSEDIADDAGAYAILAYAVEGGRPTVVVTDCVIDGARSCGVYAASAAYVEVQGTHFARITDRRDATLPKAAIALANSPNFKLSGNSFANCYKKIVVTNSAGRREITPR